MKEGEGSDAGPLNLRLHTIRCLPLQNTWALEENKLLTISIFFFFRFEGRPVSPGGLSRSSDESSQ